MQNFLHYEFESTLSYAQFAFSSGNYNLAEKCYLQALIEAEIAYGNDSAEVGIVALNFADFLVQVGRADDIRPLMKRVCHCLLKKEYGSYVIEESTSLVKLH